jgi:hypothetical protein
MWLHSSRSAADFYLFFTTDFYPFWTEGAAKACLRQIRMLVPLDRWPVVSWHVGEPHHTHWDSARHCGACRALRPLGKQSPRFDRSISPAPPPHHTLTATPLLTHLPGSREATPLARFTGTERSTWLRYAAALRSPPELTPLCSCRWGR